MSKAQTFVPDRWLVCSDAAMRSLEDHWSDLAGPDSLLAWRLRNGMIESTQPTDVEEQISDLVRGDVYATVVFDEADGPAYDAVSHFDDNGVIRSVVWRNDPIYCVQSMNAPDRALLEILQGTGASETGVTNWPTTHLPLKERPAYLAALANWEANCRAADVKSFGEAYPGFADRKVSWADLIGPRYNVPVPANDIEWIELKPAIGFSTPGQAIQINDPSTPSRWTITMSPRGDGVSVWLAFKVNPGFEAEIAGQRVLLRTDEFVLDLGIASKSGTAKIKLAGPIDLSASTNYVALVSE